MFVRDWMTSPAVTVDIGTPAASAFALMNLRGIRRLPVLDDGRLAGIVTRTDLTNLFGPGIPGRRGMNKLVVEIMKKHPFTISPDDTIETAARIMLRKKFSGLPVIDHGRVVGVITESDLFRGLCRMLGVDGRGARVAVTLPDDRALVDFLSNRLADFEIQNLVTVPRADEGGWNVVMRVRGRVPAGSR